MDLEGCVGVDHEDQMCLAVGEGGDRGRRWREGRTGSPGGGKSLHNGQSHGNTLQVAGTQAPGLGMRHSGGQGSAHELPQVVKEPCQAAGAADSVPEGSHCCVLSKGIQNKMVLRRFLASLCVSTAVHCLSISIFMFMNFSRL